MGVDQTLDDQIIIFQGVFTRSTLLHIGKATPVG
jgi:hypothetical protein